MMTTFDNITTADPLIACLLRAARRGREIREQQAAQAQDAQVDVSSQLETPDVPMDIVFSFN